MDDQPTTPIRRRETRADQLERARLDNREQWRNAGIVCAVLVITGVGLLFVPFVVIFTLIGTRRNERDARAGVYDLEPRAKVNEKALNRWLGAGAAVGFGVWLVVNGTWPSAGLWALLLFGVAAFLRPWQFSLRPAPANGQQRQGRQ